MSSRLCSSCNLAFAGSQLLKQEQGHHGSRETIMAAADQGCYVCGIITRSDAWRAMNADAKFESAWYLDALSGNLSGWFNLTIDAVGVGQDLTESTEGSDEELVTLEPDRVAHGHVPEDGETTKSALTSGPIWGFALQPATGKHCHRRR